MIFLNKDDYMKPIESEIAKVEEEEEEGQYYHLKKTIATQNQCVYSVTPDH